MLAKLFARFLSVLKGRQKTQASMHERADRASALMRVGNLHGAIQEYQEHLKANPFDVPILNDLAVCLSNIGDAEGAHSTFELAHSLDDAFIPVVTNHAKMLVDKRRSTEALDLLRRAKICEPGMAHTDAVYGGLCFGQGDPKKACSFHLRAWLANFNDLRSANCYLFNSSYDDLNEKQIAAEHRFWAETLPHSPETSPSNSKAQSDLVQSAGTRVRIGYWSPDIRTHSVAFFFHPLLKGHDAARFEIFLFHDFPKLDLQTGLMRDKADHFFEVSELPDDDLCELIRSHDLDILVELAGHSSYNRMGLMQRRMATIQISALGYPPTTGLSSIDAKLLDRHVVTPESPAYYAEAPLVMPTSFWCFDPMTDVPLPEEPPVLTNQYITFGCVGNISKITARMLESWREILSRLPTSRLLIRSINFEDPMGEDAMRAMLARAQIDIDRVTLVGPVRGPAFYTSYNEIDIVLDTFPFSGGTTTCFATYMGVPVLTLSGESLVGRMGRSVMTNLGAAHCVVTDYAAYKQRAIELAQDIEFLRSFRREARGRYQSSSLGNGAMFAKEFEDCCVELLAATKAGKRAPYRHAIPTLPVDEIVRRAYLVMGAGQPEAAERILDYCLQTYPNANGAHLLRAQMMSVKGKLDEAIDYLLARMSLFTPQEQVASLIAVVRFNLVLERAQAADDFLGQLARMEISDPFDQLQTTLFRACRQASAGWAANTAPHVAAEAAHFLIPCDSVERFDIMRSQILAVCSGAHTGALTFERCDEAERAIAYRLALDSDSGGILVLAQKNIEIHHPQFVQKIADALTRCDVVGFFGAARWTRLDWRLDAYDQKAGSYIVPSWENLAFAEIQWFGGNQSELVGGLAVLDGSLLAFRRDALKDVDFDADLSGCQALMEEHWIHAASRQGRLLAAHHNLGIFMNTDIPLDERNRTEARMRCNELFGLDPFAAPRDNNMSLSAPIPSTAEAAGVCEAFLALAK